MGSLPWMVKDFFLSLGSSSSSSPILDTKLVRRYRVECLVKVFSDSSFTDLCTRVP